ncbi:MAG: hypothetical protein U1E29_17620 [Coriobacteriia bacterium]|nr:hypothetical protein [Coriobacteriia bacterium]
MATRRVRGADARIPGIRAAVLDHLHDRRDTYTGRGEGGRHMAAYFETLIASLESGAPARVRRWSIPTSFSASLPPGDGNSWYVIGPRDVVRRDERDHDRA